MQKEKTLDAADTAGYWVLAAMVFVFLVLLFRNSGLYPVVFADEWSYSKFSRLMPLGQAPIPSYLYLAVFQYTNSCKDGYLECARIINAVFFVGAIPFVYLTAKKLSSAKLAAFIALLCALAPVNTYTAYFMPEAMYFFLFWLLSWLALSYLDASAWRYGLLTGAIVGLMSVVKVHAILLVPGFMLFIAYLYLVTGESERVGKIAMALACFAVAAIAVRLALGYAFAGADGLSIVGTLYGGQADSAPDPRAYLRLIPPAAENLRGHLMALAILFGVPLAALLSPGSGASTEKRLTIAYTVAVVVPLLVIVALFTAFVAGSGPYEKIDRLHMRYYSFAFPLFAMIAAAQLSAGTHKSAHQGSLLAALAVGAFLLYALSTLNSVTSLNFVDGPEIRGITHKRPVFYLFGLLGLVAIIMWAFNRKRGARLFLFVVMPLGVLAAGYSGSRELRQHLVKNAYDRAGIFAHQYLDADQRAGLAVIGSSPGELFRTLFHVDHPDTAMVGIAENASLDYSKIPAGKEWLLLIGDHELPSDGRYKISMDGFSLIRMTLGDTVEFRKASWPGVIDRVSGLSESESWGRWSNAKVVKLEFASPLPRRFELGLRAHAFGPNVGTSISIRVGRHRKSIRLAPSPQDVSLSFETDGGERSVMIEVPQPVSPKALGLGNDERTLGIGVARLRIVVPDVKAP
jgi:phosphoglycerol transferase